MKEVEMKNNENRRNVDETRGKRVSAFIVVVLTIMFAIALGGCGMVDHVVDSVALDDSESANNKIDDNKRQLLEEAEWSRGFFTSYEGVIYDVTITDTKCDGDMLDIYLTSYWEYFGDEKYNYAHAKFKENPDSIYGYSIVSYVKTDEYENDIISSSNGDDFASDIVKNSVSNATGQSRLVMTKDEITKEEGRIRESVNSGTAKKRIS